MCAAASLPVLPPGGSAAHSTSRVADDDKFCSVCGDRALGYNFDAITCESCKAFFRRNAAKRDAIKCMFSGDCIISINTRRFCSACRLRKCFLVGMKKDMILGDQEKQYRKEKVLQNKEKRLRKQQLLLHHQQVALGSLPGSSESSASHRQHQMATLEPTRLGHCLAPHAGVGPTTAAATQLNTLSCDFAQAVNSEVPTLNAQASSLHPLGNGLDDDAEDSRGGFPSSDTCFHVGVVHPFLHDNLMPFDAAHGSIDVRRELAMEEVMELSALEQAFLATIGIDCDEEATREWNKCSSLELFINHTGSFVRRLVAFSKRIHYFAAMPQDAQVVLLKASVLSCMILRSAQIYDLATDCWINSRGERTSLDVLSYAFAEVDPDTRTNHSNLVRSIKQLVEPNAAVPQTSNVLTFVLLQCVSLLSPEHVKPSDDGKVVAAVSDAQLHYMALLRHHLEATRSYGGAAKLLPNLLQSLTLCKYYSQQHGKAIMSCDATRVEPLLREVFNL